ncbi:protein of unknown function [Candidatus Filomicrobium marinum]|uniref:Uncharacterized protein n=1 Tax=Candidatus Filomicrobium marinum TaxID=1608628 RepID=A0A0D6JIT9_9HYPH|nr:protein of unknown function [Candidatus Filomicrobium marinum]CPR21861.1 protein of unknown function [Candidatus Filomicrobium marinum]
MTAQRLIVRQRRKPTGFLVTANESPTTKFDGAQLACFEQSIESRSTDAVSSAKPIWSDKIYFVMLHAYSTPTVRVCSSRCANGKRTQAPGGGNEIAKN